MIRKQVYENIDKVSGKKAIIAWSGGPYSGLIWFVAYKHLTNPLPLIFFDDSSHSVRLYSFIESVARSNGLDLIKKQIKPGTLDDELKKLQKKYDIVLTGKPKEGCYCPLPDDRKIWNLIKTWQVPYFKPKRNMLGNAQR